MEQHYAMQDEFGNPIPFDQHEALDYNVPPWTIQYTSTQANAMGAAPHMHGGATLYVNDTYRQFQYTGHLPIPPKTPTPHHYLPFPPTSTTTPHPGAQYDPTRDCFAQSQYSSFDPYVQQHPRVFTVLPRPAEQGAASRPRNSLHRANPKPHGPGVNFTQTAIGSIVDKMHKPIVGISNTYRCPSPISVQQHATPAVSSEKAKKKHRRSCDNTDNTVTAEDHAQLALTAKEW